MSEMVERVARAICARTCRLRGIRGKSCPDNSPCGATRNQLILTDLWPEARAAIEAMREPTDGMMDAGWGQRGERAKDIWRTMIDAALK